MCSALLICVDQDSKNSLIFSDGLFSSKAVVFKSNTIFAGAFQQDRYVKVGWYTMAIQENRSVRVYSVLGDNALLFSTLSGSERMSTLFNYRLELISEDFQINLDDLLGTYLTIELELPPSEVVPPNSYRYLHGVVSDCAHVSGDGEYAHYQFSIRPWFWLLTRTADCRIFQELSVPSIISSVFDEAGFSDYEIRLTHSYVPWRYCVQYRESDFNFVARLMEQEGIYFHFKHELGKHILVLCDGYSAHNTYPFYDSVPYYPVDLGQMRERDHISQWHQQKQLQPGKFVASDFNFETPKANMITQSSMPGSHTHANFEVFDYPGEYPGAEGVPIAGKGEIVSRHRMEELAAQHEIVSGRGNARGLCAGYLFNLHGCERADQNREYLIIESHCSFNLDAYTSDSSGELTYEGSIFAIQGQQQFRAPRLTPKPIVQGPQTAIVVGPAGEEIWTDEFGRVKLQFHWDRYGESNETSSCWVRVSQLWASKGWGAMHIPRIGDEVIVEFLEGDPDRPIITGRVYNGDNRVPYELPANQTQSGIKSRSTKGGSGKNFNEIRMEDKKGDEELYVHAEKNHTNNTENDRSKWVGHNENVKVDNNRTEEVGNDETITVGNDRTESVAKNETISIGVNRSESVGSDESIRVGNDRSRQVGKNEEIAIGSNKSVRIGSSLDSDIGKNIQLSVAENQTINIGKDESVSIGKSRAHNIGDDDSLTVGKKLVINAGDEISIITGNAKIIMKKDGSITISGKDINIQGSGAINAKASKNLVMKGKKILQN